MLVGTYLCITTFVNQPDFIFAGVPSVNISNHKLRGISMNRHHSPDCQVNACFGPGHMRRWSSLEVHHELDHVTAFDDQSFFQKLRTELIQNLNYATVLYIWLFYQQR